MRIFIICNRIYKGPVGGPAGVNYKLFLANKKYDYLNNTFHIFKDRTINKDLAFDENKTFDDNLRKNSFLKKTIELIPFLNIIKDIFKHKGIIKWLKGLDKTHNFNENDIYLFHDVESAYAFNKIYPNYKTVLIYHQQGSTYNEWKSFTKRNSFMYKLFLNRLLFNTIKHSNEVAFPSIGAYESLLQSDKSVFKRLKNLKYNVLYNGFDVKSKLTYHNELIDGLIKNKNGTLYFITVSVLNQAKAIERIPEFLNQLKAEINFKWIIIGNGPMLNELYQEIKRYDLGNFIIHLKDKMTHDEVLQLFDISDFYIILQRFSIFDFATIEAMAYGNIPILSRIGGNKEIIIEENGVFVDNLNDFSGVLKIIKENKIMELKKINQKLQKNLYSEKIFLQRYADIINKVKNE